MKMNHKARMLSSDISKKRPDLEFEVGYFIETIPNYTFLLGKRNEEVFSDITIFKNLSSISIAKNPLTSLICIQRVFLGQ